MFVFAITALGITIIGLAFGDVILSPSSPATIENNPLTLTCNYTGQETVTYFVFKVIKKNQTLFNNIVIINAECNTVLIPVDTNLYEYACPSDKKYSWTIKNVTRQNEGERYQCAVDTPSPGVINSNDVIISIHDPPTVPTFKIHGTTVSGTVKVIRNKTLSISCISSGNPPPSYTWTYPNSPDRPGQILTINNVQSDTRLTCSVQNTINPTGGANVTWSNSSYIDVEVLYPPKLQGLNKKNIVTGSRLNLSIPYEKGNPQDTTFKWTRNGDNREWNNQILYIENITKLDDMMYTCTVKNEMTPTLSVTEIGEDSKSFHLNVVYKPTITSFAVKGKTETSTVTVDENEDVTFVCIVDSNPNSSFAIAFEDKVIYRQNNTTTVRYNHKAVICLDTGIYTCSARNQYSSVTDAMAHLKIYVKCSPRPLHQMKVNFTSSLNETVTLNFTTLAYPEPGINGFTWYKQNSFTWVPLLSNADLRITSSGLQTNLTIKRVFTSDFGHYRVTVTNDIGRYDQYLYLVEKKEQSSRDIVRDFDTTGQQSDNTGLIVSVTLGVLFTAVTLYAILMTIYLKRKLMLNETRTSASTKQMTYANLSYRTEDHKETYSRPLGDAAATTIGQDNDDSIQQYTDLVHFPNDDQKTYDVIQKHES